MRAITLLSLTLTAFACTFSALAQEAPKTLASAGQTVLNISATERLQVPQDLLIASLRIEKTGSDAKTIQNDINALMKTAVDKAKAVSGIKVSTGGYYVYEETSAPDKTNSTPKKIWRGSQSIDIKSLTGDDILKLAGELQGMGLVMESLTYTLSPEKADDVKDSLMEAALAKVKNRAERAAKAMHKTETEIVEVNVEASDNSPGPQPLRMMGMAASAKMATPTAEPGETEITLTVTAKALLKP